MAKKIPFYRTVTCTKALGGKRSLWHARSDNMLYSRFTGAGKTADLAIADLKKQINLHWDRLWNEGEKAA